MSASDVGQEFVVDEISGCLEGHPKLGLPLDHFRLNKFSNPEDGKFKFVRDEVRRMVTEAREKNDFRTTRSAIVPQCRYRTAAPFL